MKKIIRVMLIVVIVITTNANALDKNFGYMIINQCKANINNSANSDLLFAGVLSGLGQAYITTIRMNGIDNDFASLSPGDFAIEMCKKTLDYRKKENERTGGKYDVTQFYSNLIDIGYYMTLPPKPTQDINTTK